MTPQRDMVSELIDRIESSTGLFRVVPGQGNISLGTTETEIIIAALRAYALSPARYLKMQILKETETDASSP